MKIYKLLNDILLESDGSYYLLGEQDWDSFINQPKLLSVLKERMIGLTTVPDVSALLAEQLDAPMLGQELWASGVTYLRSKVGRQEESEKAGGSDFYARVYEAERPELFFKATRNRVVGHGGKVRIRKDSTWDVPEPELVLMINSKAEIIGYTIGNDMSSRSIEGENPLYLPQAKCYDGCASLGPCIYLTDEPLPMSTEIQLTISRDGKPAFEGNIEISQIKRGFEELVGFLYRECSFEHGALLMTGTGIVPGSDFTLQSGDVIDIHVEAIGALSNTVE
jgi:2-dehydro-3-deoxy-D-arabinonate dehydratase